MGCLIDAPLYAPKDTVGVLQDLSDLRVPWLPLMMLSWRVSILLNTQWRY